MGAAVATAGSWTVAGARGAAQRAGRVYADTGRGFAPLPASPSAGDELGLSVATDGKVVVAGAPFTSRNGLADAGTVLVFSPSSADAGWTVETLLPAAPAARDAFGYSVAVASPALAAGAPLAHGEGGAVHVFGGDRRDREVGGASGPAQLGVALAFAGSQLFAGARRDNGGGSGKSGAVYLVPNDSQRVGPALRANPPVNGAELGFDLAGGPGALVIGAFGEGGTGAAYVTGEASTATAVVQLLKSADAVAEEDGGIDITVTVSPADHPDLTVLLATADGTARAGSDYEETLRTVTIPPGLDRQTVHIPVFADSSCEGDETFTVSLSSPAPPQAGVVLGPQTQETVTIHDTPVLVLTPSPLAFAEQGDPVQLSVQLSCPPAGRVTVGLKAEGGSGTILPPLLTFSAGSTAPQQALVTSLGTCDTNPSYKIVARVKSSRDPRYLNRQGETLAECVSSTLTPFHQDDGTLLFTDVLCNHGPVSAPYSTEIAPLGANVVWAGADNGVALVGFGADRVLWRGIVPPCRGNQGTMAIRIVSARTPS